MATTPPLPKKSNRLRIYRDTEVARGEFRARRLEDPLRDYNSQFPSAELAASAVVGSLDVIMTIPANRELIADLVGGKETYAALRSLAATPISSDDLETLLRFKVNKTAMRGNQSYANALSTLIKSCLDPKRFPWIAENRPATPEEVGKAKLATSILTTVSAVQAARRGDERKALEGYVKEILLSQGFVNVKKRRGGIQLPGHFPQPGQFMTTCKLGEHNADFVIGLLDGRILALECKASNSEVNGFKRLNKEVVVDAADWIRKFGENVIVASAALRGVFKPANVEQAQDQKVYIFWWHRMRSLEQFLTEARP